MALGVFCVVCGFCGGCGVWGLVGGWGWGGCGLAVGVGGWFLWLLVVAIQFLFLFSSPRTVTSFKREFSEDGTYVNIFIIELEICMEHCSR